MHDKKYKYRIWSRVADSIFNDDNRYAKHASFALNVFQFQT